MTDELRVHTQIHSRYQVFDASGKLPFSIVFGLCRRSPADTEPRPLLLDIAGSALDVPYALAHGLLTLYSQDPSDILRWIPVDLSRLENVTPKEARCLSLPSPINRAEHWRRFYDLSVSNRCQRRVSIDPRIEKRYRIRLASKDLGVKRWAYSDKKQLIDNECQLNHGSKAIKLVNSKSTAGNATFKVLKSLPWPPTIETRMCLCAPSSPSSNSALSYTTLEVSATNTGSEPVTVQTQGHQGFLVPWGPFQPEPGSDDHRVRIIHATPRLPPTSGLQVVNSATGEVVRANEQRGVCHLSSSNIDRRPKLEDVVVLKPGVPVIKKIDISSQVNGLQDGQYNIRMKQMGCRWWHGEIGEEKCEDGRVPVDLGGVSIPPLMLESLDEVELCVKDGKVL